MARKQLRLGAFMRPVSIHTAAWRYPGGTPDANFNLEAIVSYAQKLEAGRFDAFFMADHLAVLNMPMDALKRSATVTSFDLPVMVAVTVIALPIVLTGFVVRRWEGALLLAYYVAYLVYIVMGATGRPTEALSEVMLTFVIPATALGLGLAAWAELRGVSPPTKAERAAGPEADQDHGGAPTPGPQA